MGKINLEAPINSLGYGQVGYNILKGLVHAGQDPTLFPIGKLEITNEQSKEADVQSCLERTLNLDPTAPTLKIYHQFALASHIGRGPYFAWPIFELNQFSTLEKAHMRVPETLIVCSQWAKQVCKEQGFDNVVVVPLGYDPLIFDEYDRQPDGKYIFLNCGKWETRKGHDVLIKAFLDAFELTDQVELWMMPTNPFLTEQETKTWETKYKQNKLWSKVKIFPRLPRHVDVANIMCNVDCGVFPARAEGWNLEALEMLACKKEVIITDYSAHSEFANKDNSHLINITELETAFGQNETEKKWFYGQGMWAHIDKNAYDQLVHHMRYCYLNRPRKAKENTSARFYSWDNITQLLLENIYED